MKPIDFIECTLRVETQDCVLWPFAKNEYGYGILRFEGRCKTAHRVICRKAHGEPPKGKNDAAHICGNSACINPKHLAWKTRQENEADKVVLGTIRLGEKHWLAVWDDESRAKAIAMFDQGMPVAEIARTLKIPRPTVSNMIHRNRKRASKREAYLSRS